MELGVSDRKILVKYISFLTDLVTQVEQSSCILSKCKSYFEKWVVVVHKSDDIEGLSV